MSSCAQRRRDARAAVAGGGAGGGGVRGPCAAAGGRGRRRAVASRVGSERRLASTNASERSNVSWLSSAAYRKLLSSGSSRASRAASRLPRRRRLGAGRAPPPPPCIAYTTQYSASPRQHGRGRGGARRGAQHRLPHGVVGRDRGGLAPAYRLPPLRLLSPAAHAGGRPPGGGRGGAARSPRRPRAGPHRELPAELVRGVGQVLREAGRAPLVARVRRPRRADACAAPLAALALPAWRAEQGCKGRAVLAHRWSCCGGAAGAQVAAGAHRATACAAAAAQRSASGQGSALCGLWPGRGICPGCGKWVPSCSSAEA